ncbi:MAG: hypothetical protein GY727_03720 [Gammaproteobacteria bacterium]|nr:hypothetical protein [Gammaproteobacteria bacterium]MCP4090539.1 hypothetical protein [Gammaproteobacteria bacterium]MCP4276596.1 hypothetical protein [Gammaproteobacteria bacterium]MCP4831338.1 hypothetical protein [Gammaproteobacteria bacterium]MCP4928730.1 hypothetical protein [Gammaproteobacteria bacterium]
MLGAIRRVTITATDLTAVEKAYTQYLKYRVSERTTVTAAEAAAWNAPAIAGAASLSMQPAGSNDFEFRFIAGPTYPDYIPLTTYGWNASEIMVQSVDTLAPHFESSPFEIVGEPRNLSFSEDIRAMQLRGPADEIIYLTEFKNPVPGLSVPTARSAVDRTFIVILGGQSMDEIQEFYSSNFSVPKAPVMESRVTMLSRALGVSIETLYPIAAMALDGESLIEADEMPAQVSPREIQKGFLPPGIAIVGFDCDKIPATATMLNSNIHIMEGITGELIELHSI